MRKLALVVVLILTAALAIAEGEKLQFNWAFVKRGPGGVPQPINFSENVSILRGDLFKISIQPVNSVFLYLFLHDAGGNLQLLFPDSFQDFEQARYVGGRFLIPAGENWFTLDSAKGTERFYLLASMKRLEGLEKLTSAYQRGASSEKAAQRQAVLDEIARLIAEHSKLRMVAEKPVTVAGGTRGIDSPVAKLATRIEAEEFYTKTFRLEH